MIELLPLFVLDAFTDQAFKGNPCAVVVDADSLSSEQMQTVAREMNLPETVFVLQSSRAAFRVRFFTPREEIPFAGHPTIATAFALAELGRIPLSSTSVTVDLEFSIGVLPVVIDIRSGRAQRAVMTQPRPVFGEVLDRETAAGVLGLTIDDLHTDSPP